MKAYKWDAVRDEVIAFLREGKPIRQVARSVGITERTILRREHLDPQVRRAVAESVRLRTKPIPHGQVWVYTHYGCRCEPCTDANSAYRRLMIARKWGKKPPSHGTQTGYAIYGCRCDKCRAYQSVKNREYRERRAERESA